ncbi:MarR family transcriptional regulator [Lactobacillus sp. ESL0785]|uniref:MarR family winged helix-turn-helix transcriptional regulator n=1 Tax=Lactobacillus sp. ESL0785 TaxID=2983232 RepID=UPI0023F793A9|nr:MarR family transcriptional regulator [Lactobacillus sp. ESL0785]WEV70160.1 MarR family transcriptional regulator [Lactobacillus sp. ESL0785]
MDILSFSTISGKIKKEISHRCGLNLSQTRILLYFDKNSNKAMKMGNLAVKLKISLSTLSRQLKQPKTLGYLAIIRSENDSSKIVNLNDNGLKKVTELKQTLQAIEQELFKNLSENERQTLTKLITKLIQAVTEANSL